MQGNLNEVFNHLPHVMSIWVLPNGEWYSHPKVGATKIDRPIDKPIAVGEIKKSKKSK